MATNKPPGDDARKGAVRKRSQLKTKVEGEEHWTKRSRDDGQFMSQKKDPNAGPYGYPPRAVKAPQVSLSPKEPCRSRTDRAFGINGTKHFHFALVR